MLLNCTFQINYSPVSFTDGTYIKAVNATMNFEIHHHHQVFLVDTTPPTVTAAAATQWRTAIN